MNHYRRAARWRIKLSDAEAMNFSVTEMFVLALRHRSADAT